jgi:hypothetical protein
VSDFYNPEILADVSKTGCLADLDDFVSWQGARRMMKDHQQEYDAVGGKAAGKMKRDEFEKELAKLQVELTRLQAWVQAQIVRVCEETSPQLYDALPNRRQCGQRKPPLRESALAPKSDKSSRRSEMSRCAIKPNALQLRPYLRGSS